MGKKLSWQCEKPTCDLCKVDLNKEEFFCDCVMRNGQWALLCPSCYGVHGKRFGQKYEGASQVKICDLHK